MIEFRRAAILAEGSFGILTSKTAVCLVRYVPDKVCCIIDSSKRGKLVEDILGFGGAIPIVGSIEEAMELSPDTLLIGIAPRGGLLPEEWRQIILRAIAFRLNIISGLHTMLTEDPEIREAARGKGVSIWDIRKPIIPDGVLTGRLAKRDGRVILTVGSDSRTGKMTVGYELVKYLELKGIKAAFVPTGQTGILLGGNGYVIDRIAGDFMSRVVEDLTYEALKTADVVVVEGQGSLVHPAYSGVALSIIHGCYPDAMILCHQPTRKHIEGYGVEIPPLEDLITLHETIARPVFESKVIAIAVNTFDLTEVEALHTIETIHSQTRLPTDDVIRWGWQKLSAAVEAIL